MAAARKLPSSDEVGLKMFEQLLGHSGKARVRELLEPEAPAEEAPKEDELNIDDLEQLLATQGS